MSTNTIAAVPVVRPDAERTHRILMVAGYLAFLALLGALAIYGFDYYGLDAAQRPFSPKHAKLKPSGSVGLKLGYLGLAMFFTIFLYPIRRRWLWLASIGSSRHWLNFHMLLGVMAPFIVAFHSSFKFSGFAGVAFWIMVAVAVSGVLGRYVYGQIPRALNSAEISSSELQDRHTALAQQLAQQKLIGLPDLQVLLRLPNTERVQRMSLLTAISYMIALDIVRPLRVARVRRGALSFSQKLNTFGGLLATRNVQLERAIAAARQQASLDKRILFLSRAREVFQSWHIIHRPFSYSFLVLAVIHIVAVSLLGFVRWS